MKTENFFSKNKTLLIVLGIIFILIISFVGMYNRFVTLDQDVNSKWSEVENQYQRQADLIGNIISVVSSSVGVETKFVKDVIAQRTNWQAADSVADKDRAGVQMSNGAVTFVNAVAENYPQLQANKQYVALTDELSGTQNRITTSRGRYIESIQKYNTAVKKFPGNLFAGLFGFGQKDYYKAELASMETPTLGAGQLPQ
mgnify:CR=1 FL=1